MSGSGRFPYPHVNVDRVEGSQWVIRCPYCGEEHRHSFGAGHRVSHCASGVPDNAGYIIDPP